MASEVNNPHGSPDLQVVQFPVVGFTHGISTQFAKFRQSDSKAESEKSFQLRNALDQSTSVEFEKQLDELAIWFENWSHDERCQILEYLILHSDYAQFQLLWTAAQPILHRDFMFTSLGRYPAESFAPFSTETTRATRQRLTRNRTIQRYHRAKSVYLRDENDVKSQLGLQTDSPEPENAENRPNLTQHSVIRLPRLHHRNSLTNPVDHVIPSYENPKANWMTAMQVRRHLQEDEGRLKVIDASPSNSQLLYDWYKHWTGPQRATFYRLALMKLDARQLYFVASFLAVRCHRDMLSLLPSGVAHRILSYLNPVDLSNCAKVSTSWRDLCYHNLIWKRKCQETRMGVRPVATPKLGGWRGSYREDRVMKRNWREGRCEQVELIGHSDSVLAVALKGNVVVSGSKDCTVRVWNVESARLTQCFTGHQKGVWSVAIVSAHLVASGSYDRTVKVWRLGPRGGCLRTLFGHQGPVWAMVCKRHYLASGSQDRMVKLWDMRHCVLHQTLRGHGSAVFAMDADEDMTTLFTGSADRSIRVWNVQDGRCLRVIWTGERSSVMSLSCDRHLLACASSGKVTVWEHSTGTRVRAYKAHKKRIETVLLRVSGSVAASGVVITGGKDGKIKYWNLHGPGKVNQLQGHEGQVNAVTCDATRIASASYDGTIRIWDFRDFSDRL